MREGTNDKIIVIVVIAVLIFFFYIYSVIENYYPDDLEDYIEIIWNNETKQIEVTNNFYHPVAVKPLDKGGWSNLYPLNAIAPIVNFTTIRGEDAIKSNPLIVSPDHYMPFNITLIKKHDNFQSGNLTVYFGIYDEEANKLAEKSETIKIYNF